MPTRSPRSSAWAGSIGAKVTSCSALTAHRLTQRLTEGRLAPVGRALAPGAAGDGHPVGDNAEAGALGDERGDGLGDLRGVDVALVVEDVGQLAAEPEVGG